MIRTYISVILQIKMKTAINSSLSLFWMLGARISHEKTDLVLTMQSYLFCLSTSLLPT